MKDKNSKNNLKEKIISASRSALRFALSRYFISAIIILVEVILVEHLFITIAENFFITTAAVLTLHAVGFIHLINRDTNPEYKVTWLVVMMIPVAGVLLYFLFFERRPSAREAELLMSIRQRILLNERPSLDPKEKSQREESPLPPPLNTEHRGIVRALLADDPLAAAYRGTASTFFSSGEEYFRSLIADIASAEKYIFLEYFIIEDGELWQKILLELKKKAALGVDVRVLYDDIGSMQTLPPFYEKKLREMGICAYRFGRVTPKLSAIHNNRDHRKIAVIDGKIAYTGGVNIADEYANIKEKYGHWQDGGIRVIGSAALGLARLFLSAWDYTAGATSDYKKLLQTEKTDLDDGGIYIPFGSGPPPIYKEKVGKNLFINLINSAEDSLCITTPYLIADYELTEALCKASRRGVDVRIITPGTPDKKIIKIMTKSSYPHLIASGVKIYEYTPGFIHEKTLIADEKYLVVGTVNLDYRSLMHHFEDGILVINSPIIGIARAAFENTISKSEYRSSDQAKLNIIEWLLRNIMKIFAPLM